MEEWIGTCIYRVQEGILKSYSLFSTDKAWHTSSEQVQMQAYSKHCKQSRYFIFLKAMK